MLKMSDLYSNYDMRREYYSMKEINVWDMENTSRT